MPRYYGAVVFDVDINFVERNRSRTVRHPTLQLRCNEGSYLNAFLLVTVVNVTLFVSGAEVAIGLLSTVLMAALFS
jgi:hypothetical protein